MKILICEFYANLDFFIKNPRKNAGGGDCPRMNKETDEKNKRKLSYVV